MMMRGLFLPLLLVLLSSLALTEGACSCVGCTNNLALSAGTVTTYHSSSPCTTNGASIYINMMVTDTGSLSGASTFSLTLRTEAQYQAWMKTGTSGTTNLGLTGAVSCFDSLTYHTSVDPSPDLYISITCENYAMDCPIKYNILFKCDGAVLPPPPPPCGCPNCPNIFTVPRGSSKFFESPSACTINGASIDIDLETYDNSKFSLRLFREDQHQTYLSYGSAPSLTAAYIDAKSCFSSPGAIFSDPPTPKLFLYVFCDASNTVADCGFRFDANLGCAGLPFETATNPPTNPPTYPPTYPPTNPPTPRPTDYSSPNNAAGVLPSAVLALMISLFFLVWA